MAHSISHSVVVDVPPEVLFNILADPSRHSEIDGSDTVHSAVGNPSRLSQGSRFRMRMHRGVPYLITNTVVEFTENRRIAWRHWGRHIWRWELEPVGTGATRVTETFDWGPAMAGAFYPALGFVQANDRGIRATLARLVSRFGTVDA